MARCLIFANPKAGALRAAMLVHKAGQGNTSRGAWGRSSLQADSTEGLSFLAAAAERAGLDARVEAIPPPGALPAVYREAQAQGFDTVVAVGGDGTVRALAQELIGSPLRLGILPMGTDNNFARALGLPMDLDAALRVVAEGQGRQVDVGRIANEYFLEGAGVGLFADTLDAFGPQEPHLQEALRLLQVFVPLCWNPRARHLALILDGVRQEEDAIMVTVANTRYMGPRAPVAPTASLSDGLFDVVIVGPMSRWELLTFARALRRGLHLELPGVRCVQASRVEIQRRRFIRHPLPVHADDHIADRTPTLLTNISRALRVLAPAIPDEPDRNYASEKT